MEARMTRVAMIAIAMACTLSAPSTCAAQADYIETRPVRLANGASSITLKGSLKGGKIIDYRLRGKAGQTMRVTLDSDNPSNHFNVLPPGSRYATVFMGSTGGNEWTGPLAADGDYTIRVYLARQAAGRNETAGYTLTLSIAAAGAAAGRDASGGDGKVKAAP
jgi:hypothetical protein